MMRPRPLRRASRASSKVCRILFVSKSSAISEADSQMCVRCACTYRELAEGKRHVVVWVAANLDLDLAKLDERLPDVDDELLIGGTLI